MRGPLHSWAERRFGSDYDVGHVHVKFFTQLIFSDDANLLFTSLHEFTMMTEDCLQAMVRGGMGANFKQSLWVTNSEEIAARFGLVINTPDGELAEIPLRALWDIGHGGEHTGS